MKSTMPRAETGRRGAETLRVDTSRARAIQRCGRRHRALFGVALCAVLYLQQRDFYEIYDIYDVYNSMTQQRDVYDIYHSEQDGVEYGRVLLKPWQ
jgi:hypothetical protein